MAGPSRILALLCLALIAAAAHADDEPAAVKAAMKHFYQSLEAGDAQAVRACFHAATPDEKDLADADAAQLAAARALGQSARAKYAATGDALSKGLPLADRIARLDSAKIAVAADTATIQLDPDSKPLTLIRVDGQWKIPIADYAGVTPDNIAVQIAVLKDLAQAYTTVAAGIDSGKYPSAQQAQRALQRKLQSIISNALHKHHPATRPK